MKWAKLLTSSDLVCYIGKSVISVHVVARMLTVAYFRDLIIGLVQSVQGDVEWCGTHSHRQQDRGRTVA